VSKQKDLRCDVCETSVFERNDYFTGKLMYPRDFCAEQDYFNEKRWLLNRSLFGWGVVCGLDVKQLSENGPLVVEPGLALDCCGHEILVCEEQCITLRSLEDRCSRRRPGSQHRLVVCLEYAECKTEPVVDPGTPDCEGSQRTRYNRIRDSHRILIRSWDELCLEHEKECYLDWIKSRSDTHDWPRCRTPTLHDYLCDRSRNCPACESCDCVVLAVLRVTFGGEPGYGVEQDEEDAESWNETTQHQAPRDRHYKDRAQDGDDEREEPEPPTVEIDTCTYRRLVYPNPLLHELIACFHPDAPHIVKVDWREAVEGDRIDWSAWVELVKSGGISVVFDQPIDARTLHRRSFLVTVLIRESGTGYTVQKYVPCREIEYRPHDPRAGCYTARFLPEHDWVRDEVDGRHSELAEGVDVEIILRGSMITGTNGRALDGDYINGRLPTGNGVQAGDFIDWFTVGPRDTSRRTKEYEEAEEGQLIKDF
jgi:hypothetical protein